MPTLASTTDFFGSKLNPPPGIAEYQGGEVGGLIFLLNNILKITIFAAGIFTLINLLTSGIGYIGSSGNPETIKKASSRIWMSLIGLLIIAASVIIAGLIGLLFFGSATAIISPTIPGPGS